MSASRGLSAAVSALFVIAAAAFVACSGGDGAAASPTATAAGPPQAFLQAGSHDFVPGGIGPYCWDGACDEAATPVTAEDAFPLAAGASVALIFEAGQPAELRIQWLSGDSPPAANEGVREWADATARPSVAEGSQAPTKAGGYLIVVDGSWPRGDIRYSFYVSVQ